MWSRSRNMTQGIQFLIWRLTLNEQINNHGYSGNYDMVMNLAQAMLAGRGLEVFLSE
jgi:hypothetical protein